MIGRWFIIHERPDGHGGELIESPTFVSEQEARSYINSASPAFRKTYGSFVFPIYIHLNTVSNLLSVLIKK